MIKLTFIPVNILNQYINQSKDLVFKKKDIENYTIELIAVKNKYATVIITHHNFGIINEQKKDDYFDYNDAIDAYNKIKTIRDI